MVKLARLDADAFQTVKTAAIFARQQCHYEVAIGKEIERFQVEFDHGCAFRHDSRNFYGKENADQVAIA